MKNPHKVFPQLLVAAVGSLGFLCTGTTRGWSSPGIPSLNATESFEISSTDLSWIAGFSTMSAIVGAFFVGYPLQYFGRRTVLIGLCLPFWFGYMLMGLADVVGHKALVYVGRSLTGIMYGAMTPASQIYISECSSPRIRGFLSSLTAGSLALGILLAYIFGAFVEWWLLAYLMSVFPLFMMAGLIFMPETPFWLLSHNREDEARKVLQRLRGKRTDIENEFQRMKNNYEENRVQHQDKFQLRDLLKGVVWKPLSISMVIMFFQQLTGTNAMIFFTVSIFQSAGTSLDSHYSTIIIGFIQLIFTLLSGFMVDRFGRRLLLLSSAAVVSCSLAAMGTFFYFQKEWGASVASERIGWLPLTSLVIFFIAYSCGFANVPFILMGELFPSRYRSTLSSICSCFNVLCAFSVVRCFPDMQIAMGRHGTFWFFMTCTLVGIIFVYFFLPETKGKTLEDIEKLFSNKKYHVDSNVEPMLNAPLIITGDQDKKITITSSDTNNTNSSNRLNPELKAI